MNQQNQYDFILNPEKPKKQPVQLSQDPKMFIGFIFFSVAVIIIALLGLSTIINSGTKGQKQNFINMQLTQTELVRVAELPTTNKAASDTTKNIAANTRLTILSQQQTTSILLGKRGQKKPNEKLLATSVNKKTDTLLEEAARENKFNETYRKNLKETIQKYQLIVNEAYERGNKAEKDQLKIMYDSNATLLETLK
jgi:hypothetical protein